jgi:hypothetical protein
MNLLVLVVDDEPDVEMLFRQQFRRDLRLGRFTMEFAQSGDNDERKFNEMAAPIEHDAPWLKRSKSASGVEEVA